MTEDGAASLALLAVAGVAMVLAVAIAGVGTVLRARSEAGGAADAAALAAAPVTFLPFGSSGVPSREAARFAGLNGVRLVRCSCPVDRSWNPRTVAVAVESEVEVWPLGTFTVSATARAEFVPALLLDG